MDTKYGKLISRDKNGNLTAVYPEIACDHEIDFQNKRAVNPVSNYVIAEALEGLKGDIKNAFTSESGGLGWNDSTQKGYVDFSKMPSSQIEGIVSSMVDPNGAIVADSSSGKLTVDFSKLTAAQVMDLCSTNGGIIASNETGANHGKLAIDFSKMPADQIKNVVNSMVDQTGAIIPNTSVPSTNPNYGKLTVDFSKLTAAQVMALCLAGGGIVADADTGKLKIDFSKIDADTKRNITSSLKMQVPLTTNKTVYVDNVNGNDTYLDSSGVVIEGKGEARTTAFKTINTAIRFVTEQWASGTKNITILLIANSTPYSEWITLPTFNRTTGMIYIKSENTTNRAKIVNPGAVGTVINCVGGAYELQNIDIEANFYKINNGRNNYPALIWASNYGSLNIAGCHCKASFIGDADDRWMAVRMFGTSTFGRMQFILINGSHNIFEYHKNNASNLTVITSENNGWFNFGDANADEVVSIDIPVSNESTFETIKNKSDYSSLTVSNSSTTGNKIINGHISVLQPFMRELGLGTNWALYLHGESLYQIEAWGECTTFCSASVMSLVRYGSGSLYKTFFTVPKGKQATGQRFNCANSSAIFVTMTGAFPGDVAGTVETATYCAAKTALG